jgi:tetratricopeptide (TPR) repeat protein
VDTCDELLDIFQQARSRIMARIEEEKPKPNVTRLLEQWRRDQQPGRALQWEERHAQYVAQLPDPLKQSLHQFQDTFDDIVEASGQQYISGIKREAELAGVAGKAREYFECQDPDGLRRLLSVLDKHQDQKQAVAYIPLLQGYLAELSGKPDTAITEYQKITNSPSRIDALFRLFAMYTNAQNFEAALAILKTLSSISATYSPMYADMLYASGDIDNAVEVYTDYLLSNPDDLETMMKLGKVFAEGGSSDGVAWTMGYILEKDPGNQAARDFLNNLGVRV